ncbi:TIGR04222 domain-containing membrane protein [Streptomyces sp. NPDC051976]|uniref:TIGR04222 domain-containing membrane protein n=1 Tax=Streptomyces sp. NPDC051976 TaxID=3154947 RepID=UPI00341E9208
MSQPWGLSGPQFLGVYAGVCVLSIVLVKVIWVAVRRSAGPAVPVTADVYTLALLSGGSARVVDTAVQALVESGQLRVSRDHVITVCGTGIPEEPVQRAVLACVGRVKSTNLTGVRRLSAAADPVTRISRAAAEQGLLLSPGRRRKARAAMVLPAAVFGMGVARLVNGVRLHRPVGLLVLFLVITVVVSLIVAAGVPKITQAGQDLRDRARKGGGPDPEEFGSYGSYGSYGSVGIPGQGGAVAWYDGQAPYEARTVRQPGNLRVPATVLGVAALGAVGVADPTLRQALYGGITSSSGGGGSTSGCGGGGGGGCGGGGCGGGCGG